MKNIFNDRNKLVFKIQIIKTRIRKSKITKTNIRKEVKEI